MTRAIDCGIGFGIAILRDPAGGRRSTLSRGATIGAAAGLGLFLLGSCADRTARTAEPTQSPPPWPRPADWKAETIPFPLDFAPRIHHTGVEELRFAPAFFTPTAPGYFSYAFVWWLKDAQPLPPAVLAAELNQYYEGLCSAVGKKKFALDPARYRVQLAPEVSELPLWEAASGQAELYDAFTTGQPLSLRLHTYQRDCPHSGHRAVLVLASPQPESAPIWAELRARAEAFRCP